MVQYVRYAESERWRSSVARRASGILWRAVLCWLASAPGFASGAVKERTALIADSSGTTSEVTGLRVEARARNIFAHVFPLAYEGTGVIVLDTKPFFLGIPLDAVISVDAKGQDWIVKCLRDGQERVISGQLVDFGALVGKTDFGAFRMEMAGLRKLSFKERPSGSPIAQKKPLSYSVALLLTNGERFRVVADFRRFSTYCSSAGYLAGCGDHYDQLTDFSFSRGDSVQTVDFNNIKAIEFTDGKHPVPASKKLSCPTGCGGDLQGDVTVTLRNGKSASGKLTRDATREGGQVDGYTGTYENGDFPFFLDPAYVRTITFEAAK
jgi:hypothetical protein